MIAMAPLARWRCSLGPASSAGAGAHRRRRATELALGVLLLASAWAVPAGAAGSADVRVVQAARQRDVSGVVALIKQHADVNAATADGASALHWAAHWNEPAIVDALIAAGARIDAANEYGATPLWLASVNGSAGVIASLLKAGANPGTPIVSGETPLMSAARSGSVDSVKRLLGAGAAVNAAESARGQTALMWATAERHMAVVQALLDAGAKVDMGSTSGFTALMFAARVGDLEIARLLLERGAAINAQSADGSTPLLVATVRGHVALARFLLDRKADPNASGAGYTPLHWAVGTWETSTTFDYRLTEGEWAALIGIPSRAAKLEMIAALIAAGADVNALTTKTPPRYGFTLFGQQQARIVGASPFFLAAIVADVEVMKLLVAAGAKPLVADADGTTPLMVAAGRCRVDNETHIPESAALEATRLVLDLGADVNGVNNMGEAALHSAALAGLESVVDLLVTRGASVNAKTKAGKTPLAMAQGTVVAMQLVVRPGTIALLRKLGGVSQ